MTSIWRCETHSRHVSQFPAYMHKMLNTGTNQLTPSSRVLDDRPPVPRLVKTFTAYSATRIFNTMFTRTSDSNIEFLESFQSKVLRIITDAPPYVPYAVIQRDLKLLSVRQEVRNYSDTYRHRIDDHPSDWQNLYFKELLTFVGLRGIAMQI